MRTAYRVLSTAVAAGAIFPVGLSPAHASVTLEVQVETSAWFWSSQTSGSGPNGVPYPSVPRSSSGVPEGDLAVAYKGDTKDDADGTKTSIPDKATYLLWDISGVPEGSSVEEFTFTMFLDPEAEQLFAPTPVDVPGQGSKGGPPAIVACAATIGFGEADGDAFSAKPDDNCADQAFGEYDPVAKAYTFHAPVYAQDWVDGLDNYGLGIRNTEDATEPFQLNFLGAGTIKTTIVYTPPVAAEPTTEPTIDPIPVPTVPTDTEVFVPDTQPQPQPAPQPVPTPKVVEPRKPVVVQPVAATPFDRDGALSPVFWFAMIGGVLLLGVTSLILGDPLEPAGDGAKRVRAGRHLAPSPARATRPIRPRTV